MVDVICNKLGVSDSCCRCDHARLHLPILIDGRYTCKKIDLCTLWIDSTYKEIKVKCVKISHKNGDK